MRKLLKKIFSYFFHVGYKRNGMKKIYILGIPFIKYRTSLTQSEKSKLDIIQKEFPEIISLSEMLVKIKLGASMARFGDAEFDIALQKNKDDPYQRPCESLTQGLLDILGRSSNDKLLICIPPFNYQYNNIRNYYKNVSFWEWYWLTRWDDIKKFLKSPSYGNSFFSRDAVFHELELHDLLSIWEDRHVVFVVPDCGRFFYDDRLFSNVKSKHEVIVPATSAFSQYDEILTRCLKFPKDYLFFICAGPTATLLAVALSDQGYQALDMGHFPNCYRQFLGEAQAPEMYPIKK